MMKKIKKYFKPRNYIEKLKWIRIFSNINDSTYGVNLKIHNSSKILNSTIGNNVSISDHVTVNSCNIGNECKILSNSFLYKMSMGDYSYINMDSFVLRAKIGKFCSIASHVFIGPGIHPMDFISTHPFTFLKNYGGFISIDDEKIVAKREKQSIIIGNDVWIGQGVIIMDNIKIGEGAIIGAHAVVTKDVEPYSIVVGNPAGKIRYRYSEDVIKALLNIKWWDWEKSKIKEHVEDFKHIEDFIKKYKK